MAGAGQHQTHRNKQDENLFSHSIKTDFMQKGCIYLS